MQLQDVGPLLREKTGWGQNSCIKNCILCIIMRLIFIFFGPSVAESREEQEIFMHIINILCIKPQK